MSSIPHHRLIILGSGPAGYTAAVYAARANLQPALITGLEQGGQLMTTTEVDNWPGDVEGLMGPDLMQDFEKQAVRFGAELRWGSVTHVDFSAHPHKLVVDETTPILADAVIGSTGASAKYLGLANEKRLLGRGVSACATCDGAHWRTVGRGTARTADELGRAFPGARVASPHDVVVTQEGANDRDQPAHKPTGPSIWWQLS